MGDSFNRANGSGQSSATDVVDDALATTVASDLAVLRKVIDDLDWTYEAIAVAMGEKDSYRSHIWRVVSGERPLTLEFLKKLPDDIEAEWHARLARQAGRVVVAPLSGPAAIEGLVGGLIGLLTASPALPAKTCGQLKVNLDVPRKAAAR